MKYLNIRNSLLQSGEMTSFYGKKIMQTYLYLQLV